MTLEKLKLSLCKYGDPQIVKEGYVFTVLITGTNLSHWLIVNDIQKDILEYAGDKYPNIEVMMNDNEFFLLVLRP